MLRWAVFLTGLSLLSAAVEDYIDVCIDGKHQKETPGPEDELHNQCTPWREKSCCTVNVSQAAHQDQSYLYSFNWDHCGGMSAGCKKHFIQDTCFYECSPNLGPWIQKVDQSWRKERVVNVPLCKEDCESWYTDCSADYTCMENWHTGWNWTTGTNQCPRDSKCRRLSSVFPSAKDFCEKVWSGSYRHTESPRGSGRCMQLWFTGENPNVKVARYYAELMSSAETTYLRLPALLLLPLTLLWAW